MEKQEEDKDKYAEKEAELRGEIQQIERKLQSTESELRAAGDEKKDLQKTIEELAQSNAGLIFFLNLNCLFYFSSFFLISESGLLVMDRVGPHFSSLNRLRDRRMRKEI